MRQIGGGLGGHPPPMVVHPFGQYKQGGGFWSRGELRVGGGGLSAR